MNELATVAAQNHFEWGIISALAAVVLAGLAVVGLLTKRAAREGAIDVRVKTIEDEREDLKKKLAEQKTEIDRVNLMAQQAGAQCALVSAQLADYKQYVGEEYLRRGDLVHIEGRFSDSVDGLRQEVQTSMSGLRGDVQELNRRIYDLLKSMVPPAPAP